MLFNKRLGLWPITSWNGEFTIIVHLINPFKAQIFPGIGTICLDLLDSGRSVDISRVREIAFLRGKGQADRHKDGKGR